MAKPILRCMYCKTESDIEAIPICQTYICPACVIKYAITYEKLRKQNPNEHIDNRPDGSFYMDYND